MGLLLGHFSLSRLRTVVSRGRGRELWRRVLARVQPTPCLPRGAGSVHDDAHWGVLAMRVALTAALIGLTGCGLRHLLDWDRAPAPHHAQLVSVTDSVLTMRVAQARS